jgi:hypothetical protein
MYYKKFIYSGSKILGKISLAILCLHVNPPTTIEEKFLAVKQNINNPY